MTNKPIEDIELWSSKLSDWRQDALRRLAIAGDLGTNDHLELYGMIKQAAGLVVEPPPPPCEPFVKAHFGQGVQQPIVLKGIANVQNINRLVADASLNFCPKALTVIFGRNGSGKSGFVRILRTACRTRIEKTDKLKILGNVYGESDGPQSADILIDAGAGDTAINWKPGMTAATELMPVAVFDSASAQLYVDGGNQIRFLPFGLALPHRLNSLCIDLKQRLDVERAAVVGDKIALTAIAFPATRTTAAQLFDASLTKATSNADIEGAATFSPEDENRLLEIAGILSAGATAVADISALASWTESLAKECEAAASAYSDEALTSLSDLKASADASRGAAELSGAELFTDEPLPGIGSETWRVMWAAARDYSVKEAYAGGDFPVTSVSGDAASCVLCQQPLLSDGAARMERFRKYMDDALDLAAVKAEKALAEAAAGLLEPKVLAADDFGARLEQLRIRDASLAEALSAFQLAVRDRKAEAVARLGGATATAMTGLKSPHPEANALAASLTAEKEALVKADDSGEREKLISERSELEDRKILNANRDRLVSRRDLLALDAAYAAALGEVHTAAITKRANELIDTHLTSAVVERFDAERNRFDIMHLNVSLARKSGQTKAEFDVNPQTKLTKVTSDILSEGEQRALALAGFLTEVALTDGSGPIVVDDPVSSLDRERSAKVAVRLAEEAKERQVVVFTHDIVFFNELCGAAEAQGIEPVTIALFGDKQASGKVDAAGMIWKGLSVSKRIKKIKHESAGLAKVLAESPADYEFQIKGHYGRLRDTYERVVEEIIFKDIVRRGSDVVQTLMLRYVTLSDEHAIRFHEGMTRANTHSHDNPSSETVEVPTPDALSNDLIALEALVADIGAAQTLAETARPQMKVKK